MANLPPLELYEVVDAIRAEADKHDLVLVEGAGGLLVPMGVRPSGDPWTFADLATTLGVSTVVVARAGLGTLNHTALTLEALGRRGVPAGVILGAWPAEPELVHWANLSELVPHLVGALPDGAGAMEPGRLPPVRAGLADPGALRRPRRLAGLGRRGQLTTAPFLRSWRVAASLGVRRSARSGCARGVGLDLAVRGALFSPRGAAPPQDRVEERRTSARSRRGAAHVREVAAGAPATREVAAGMARDARVAVARWRVAS